MSYMDESLGNGSGKVERNIAVMTVRVAKGMYVLLGLLHLLVVLYSSAVLLVRKYPFSATYTVTTLNRLLQDNNVSLLRSLSSRFRCRRRCYVYRVQDFSNAPWMNSSVYWTSSTLPWPVTMFRCPFPGARYNLDPGAVTFLNAVACSSGSET